MGSVTSTWPLAHPALYLQQRLTRGCTSIHFGENQLSPRSVGISPLSTSHPPVLQHWWVRASTTFHSRFTLLMDSSRGFGSHHRHARSFETRRAVHTRFPCGCPPLTEVNQATTMHSPDHSTKGTPSALACTVQEWPLTAGEYVVSGSISSPSRGAFHLSLTVLVHYRSLKVLSLGGWSPQLPTNSPGFVVLRIPACVPPPVSTGLSPAVVGRSNPLKSAWLTRVLVLQPQRFRKTPGLGSSRFARHYYGNLA